MKVKFSTIFVPLAENAKAPKVAQENDAND